MLEGEKADAVLYNGVFFTPGNVSLAGCLAVSSGRIVYVGSESGSRSFTGKNTAFIDCGGNSVLPGFFDGHSGYFEKLKKHLEPFPDIPLETDDYATAAGFFNTCRQQGIRAQTPIFSNARWRRVATWPSTLMTGIFACSRNTFRWFFTNPICPKARDSIQPASGHWISWHVLIKNDKFAQWK